MKRSGLAPDSVFAAGGFAARTQQVAALDATARNGSIRANISGELQAQVVLALMTGEVRNGSWRVSRH
jgi:hypothetical protein